MAGLTEKNKRAIDLYLSADEAYQGNGTACWQAVYGTKSENAAAVNWARMLRNANALAYMERREKEIEQARTLRIAFDRDEYMATLERLLQVTERTYVGDDGRVHVEDAGHARQIAKDLYAAETGNLFPGHQGSGLRVEININTEYRGNQPKEVTPEPDDPPPITAKNLPSVVVIGKPDKAEPSTSPKWVKNAK